MRLKRLAPAISVVILLGLLGYASARTNPIPPGDVGDYWEIACGVELSGFDGYFKYARSIGIFPSREGWGFYYYQEHHGRHVFKVPNETVLAAVPEVKSLLPKEITSTGQEGFHEVLPEKNVRRQRCWGLAENAEGDDTQFVEAVIEYGAGGQNGKYREQQLKSFTRQWELAQRYWATIAFEAVFLSFWWLYTWHGGFFGKLNEKKIYRVAFSPLFLFAPHYLGYAPYLFSYGPSGGVLYPLFAMLVSLPLYWIPYNSIEIAVLKHFPQPLFYISQVPFEALATSFSGGVSPTALCIYAVIVIAIGKLAEKTKSNSKVNK